MRRRRLYRIIALPLALWFVALVAAAGKLDACPMQSAMTGSAAAAMAGMSMPGTPATAPSSHGSTNQDPQGMPPCTCPGSCCCCATVTLPATSAVTVATVTSMSEAQLIEWRREPHAARVAHAFPPSIGPPALHIA